MWVLYSTNSRKNVVDVINGLICTTTPNVIYNGGALCRHGDALCPTRGCALPDTGVRFARHGDALCLALNKALALQKTIYAIL